MREKMAVTTIASWDQGSAKAIIAERKSMDGALLPILHALQDRFGYVDEAAVPLLADELNLSRAEVHGVITFYHDFHRHPGGRHVVKVCRAEACQSVGSVALEAHAKKQLGVDYHDTTPDGSVQLEQVFCLGNCACGPSMMVDDKLYGRVTPQRFDSIVGKLKGGR
jgi:formate dehydrogenase subunit gamma